MYRSIRFLWLGALVGTLASSQMQAKAQSGSATEGGAGSPPAKERHLTVELEGGKQERCKVQHSWKLANGSRCFQVVSVASGERLTLVQQPTGGDGQPGEVLVYAWGKSLVPPKGVPVPPDNQNGLTSASAKTTQVAALSDTVSNGTASRIPAAPAKEASAATTPLTQPLEPIGAKGDGLDSGSKGGSKGMGAQGAGAGAGKGGGTGPQGAGAGAGKGAGVGAQGAGAGDGTKGCGHGGKGTCDDCAKERRGLLHRGGTPGAQAPVDPNRGGGQGWNGKGGDGKGLGDGTKGNGLGLGGNKGGLGVGRQAPTVADAEQLAEKKQLASAATPAKPVNWRESWGVPQASSTSVAGATAPKSGSATIDQALAQMKPVAGSEPSSQVVQTGLIGNKGGAEGAKGGGDGTKGQGAGNGGNKGGGDGTKGLGAGVGAQGAGNGGNKGGGDVTKGLGGGNGGNKGGGDGTKGLGAGVGAQGAGNGGNKGGGDGTKGLGAGVGAQGAGNGGNKGGGDGTKGLGGGVGAQGAANGGNKGGGDGTKGLGGGHGGNKGAGDSGSKGGGDGTKGLGAGVGTQGAGNGGNKGGGDGTKGLGAGVGAQGAGNGGSKGAGDGTKGQGAGVGPQGAGQGEGLKGLGSKLRAGTTTNDDMAKLPRAQKSGSDPLSKVAEGAKVDPAEVDAKKLARKQNRNTNGLLSRLGMGGQEQGGDESGEGTGRGRRFGRLLGAGPLLAAGVDPNDVPENLIPENPRPEGTPGAPPVVHFSAPVFNGPAVQPIAQRPWRPDGGVPRGMANAFTNASDTRPVPADFGKNHIGHNAFSNPPQGGENMPAPYVMPENVHPALMEALKKNPHLAQQMATNPDLANMIIAQANSRAGLGNIMLAPGQGMPPGMMPPGMMPPGMGGPAMMPGAPVMNQPGALQLAPGGVMGTPVSRINGAPNPTAAPLGLLKDSLLPSEREAALDMLAQPHLARSTEVVGAVVKCLATDPAPAVRAAAARTLGRMGCKSPDAVQTLQASRSDSDAGVRLEVDNTLLLLSSKGK